MTRTSLIYVASAVLGVAAGIASLAGVQSGRTGGTDILLACPIDNPDCFQQGQIGAPCPISNPDCFQSGEKIEVACDGPNCGEVVCDGPNCGNDYRSDTKILIALANRGVKDGNG